MALENLKGSLIMTNLDATPIVDVSVQDRGARVRRYIDKVEVTAAANVLSDYLLARMPSHAVLLPQSRVYYDDLDAGATLFLDVGVFNRSGETDITDDVDGLWDNINVQTAGSDRFSDTTGALGGAGISNIEQELWQYAAGTTVDPKKLLDIKATLIGDESDNGGTIVLELFYVID